MNHRSVARAILYSIHVRASVAAHTASFGPIQRKLHPADEIGSRQEFRILIFGVFGGNCFRIVGGSYISLPVQLLVRDRRYRRRDIEAMCLRAGLDVLWARYVRAGHWDVELSPEDDNAKEILLLCEVRD